MQPTTETTESTAGTLSTILPSNISAYDPGEHDNDKADSEGSKRSALADVVFAAGMLAIMVKILLSAGTQLGGPPPTERFLTTLGPLLSVPVAILLVVLLAPGGLVRGARAGWALRFGLAVGGIGFFALSLALLNLPVLLNYR